MLGAGPESEIVPVDDTPPTTLAGLNEIVVAIGLSTVSEPVADDPKLVPVIVTTVSRLIVDVWIANTADVWPASTVTEVGTCAATLLLVS